MPGLAGGARVREGGDDDAMTYEEAHEEFQRIFLSDALTAAKGNMCSAARTIGVHRNTILRMMKQRGMRLDQFRPEHPQQDETVSASPRKKRVAAVACPECGSGRYRTSRMVSPEIGACLVRCQECFKLFSVVSAATESERAA